jgi:hypothetical protein
VFACSEGIYWPISAFRFSAVSLAAWASAIRIRFFSCKRSICSVLRLTSTLLAAVSC